MRLEPLLPDVWRWRWFSAEKGMDFNGYAVRLPAGLVVIDPAYVEDDSWDALAALGTPALTILTNKDHERASGELRCRFGAPVAIHEADAPLLHEKPERTFKDGERLAGALVAFRFTRLKSPGECALHWAPRRLLFVGDAVTGHPPGGVGLVLKHQGRPEVIEDIQSMLGLDFDALLVGDGQPLLSGAKAAVRAFVNSNRP